MTIVNDTSIELFAEVIRGEEGMSGTVGAHKQIYFPITGDGWELGLQSFEGSATVTIGMSASEAAKQ